MKGNNLKILFLAVFIFAGIAFLFLVNMKPDNQAEKVAQAANQEADFTLAEMLKQEKAKERESEVKKLNEFRRMIINLEQKDMGRFKTQTKELFMELRSMLDKYAEKNPEEMEDITEETSKIKASAEKIPGIEDPNELVAELKKAFMASEEALDELVEDDKYENELERIENKTEQLNPENHKRMTKEIFLEFYSVLEKIHRNMAKMDEMEKS